MTQWPWPSKAVKPDLNVNQVLIYLPVSEFGYNHESCDYRHTPSLLTPGLDLFAAGRDTLARLSETFHQYIVIPSSANESGGKEIADKGKTE